MATKYWIKLYHEILHDRKVAILDDHLWRRTIEIFLIAGEHNQDGILPDLPEMSWTLRTGEEELETDLNELIRIGIVEFLDGRYIVRKFSERQSPMEKSEYMRRLRDEKQKEDYQQRYQPVTNSHADTDTDKESETDKIDDDIGTAFSHFENEIGPLTPEISEKIGMLVDDYGLEKFKKACTVASENNARRMPYIEKVLANWKQHGTGWKPGKKDEDYKAVGGDGKAYINGEAAKYVKH